MPEQQQPETGFGPKFIGSRTPEWARWLFRIFFYVTSMTTLALSLFSTIPVETKLHIAEVVGFANMAVHSFSKMFGIKVEDTDYNKD
jgi:hypothetical protein